MKALRYVPSDAEATAVTLAVRATDQTVTVTSQGLDVTDEAVAAALDESEDVKLEKAAPARRGGTDK